MASSAELSLNNQLYNASCDGDIKKVQSLLERGADPNCDAYNNCALYMPVEKVHLEVVKLLLKHGARLDVQYGAGITLGTRLLINTISHFGQSPLGKDGSEEMIDILLNAGADPKPADSFGESALLLACNKGLPDLAIRLIEMGASPHLATKIGSPLEMIFGAHIFHMQYYCAEDEFIPLVKLMLSKGVDPYISSRPGKRPPVEVALKGGHYSLLIVLDKNRKYADQYEKLEKDWLLLKMYSAITSKRIDLVKEYLKQGVSANGSHPKKPATFLGTASWQSNPEFVKVLLEAGADPNLPGSDRETNLSIAYDRPENLRLLLKAGADPNAKDPKGDGTPLYRAIRAKANDSVKLLVESGAKVTVDILAFAFYYNSEPEIINCLLDHNPDRGHQPLVIAAEFGNPEQIKWFLKSGSPIDVRDKNDVTPLMAAARRGKLDNVEFLLKAGANPSLVDKNGKNAADFAADTPFIRVLRRIDLDNKYHQIIEKYAPSPKFAANRAWASKISEPAPFNNNHLNAPKKVVYGKENEEQSPINSKLLLNRILVTPPDGYIETATTNNIRGNETTFQRKVGNNVVGQLVILINDLSKNDPATAQKIEKGEYSIYSIYKKAYHSAERGGDYAPKFVVLAGHKAVLYEHGQVFLRREYQTLIGTLLVKVSLYAKDDAEFNLIDQHVLKTRDINLASKSEPIDNTASIAWFLEHIYYSPPYEYELVNKLKKDGPGTSSIYFQRMNNDGDLLGSIQFTSCDLRVEDNGIADKLLKHQVNYSQFLFDDAQKRHESTRSNVKLVTFAGKQVFSNIDQTTRSSKHGIVVYIHKIYSLQIDKVILTINVHAINEAELDNIDATIEQIIIP